MRPPLQTNLSPPTSPAGATLLRKREYSPYVVPWTIRGRADGPHSVGPQRAPGQFHRRPARPQTHAGDKQDSYFAEPLQSGKFLIICRESTRLNKQRTSAATPPEELRKGRSSPEAGRKVIVVKCLKGKSGKIRRPTAARLNRLSIRKAPPSQVWIELEGFIHGLLAVGRETHSWCGAVSFKRKRLGAICQGPRRSSRAARGSSWGRRAQDF